MKYKKITLGAVYLLLGLGGVHAQDAILTMGGDTIGNGGSMSYSIGQVVYTNYGLGPEMAYGVQQPYEISAVVGTFEPETELPVISIYPNPTTDIITLEVEGKRAERLDYKVFDLSGKLVMSGEANQFKTTIRLDGLPSSAYFLTISTQKKSVKTFKILKQ